MEDWLIQQELEKIVDVFKVCFQNFNTYFNLKSKIQRKMARACMKCRVSQQASFYSF